MQHYKRPTPIQHRKVHRWHVALRGEIRGYSGACSRLDNVFKCDEVHCSPPLVEFSRQGRQLRAFKAPLVKKGDAHRAATKEAPLQGTANCMLSLLLHPALAPSRMQPSSLHAVPALPAGQLVLWSLPPHGQTAHTRHEHTHLNLKKINRSDPCHWDARLPYLLNKPPREQAIQPIQCPPTKNHTQICGWKLANLHAMPGAPEGSVRTWMKIRTASSAA